MNARLSRKTVTILGVKTLRTSVDEVLKKVDISLKNNHKFIITTPNPEIVLKAQNDPKLLRIINSSEFPIPDGIGLAYAAKFLSFKSPGSRILRIPILIAQSLYAGFLIFLNKQALFKELPIIKGRELFTELIKLADENGWRVYLLGGNEGSAKGTQNNLLKKFKNLKIKYNTGPIFDNNGVPVDQNQAELEEEVIKDINNFQPHILFVGLGAPKQEKWITRNFSNLKIGGVMTVGGTFDFLSGRVRIPPKWVSNLGFEWLWRVVQEPRRSKRIFNAVIVFPVKVMSNKALN